MDKPAIVDKLPLELEVTGGETHYLCSCGKSETQPFCDGAHSGTNFEPVAFTREKSGKVYLCSVRFAHNLN